MNDVEVENRLNQSLLYNQSEEALINEKNALRPFYKGLSEEELETTAKENLLKSSESLKKQIQSIKDYPLPNDDAQG